MSVQSRSPLKVRLDRNGDLISIEVRAHEHLKSANILAENELFRDSIGHAILSFECMGKGLLLILTRGGFLKRSDAASLRIHEAKQALPICYFLKDSLALLSANLKDKRKGEGHLLQEVSVFQDTRGRFRIRQARNKTFSSKDLISAVLDSDPAYHLLMLAVSGQLEQAKQTCFHADSPNPEHDRTQIEFNSETAESFINLAEGCKNLLQSVESDHELISFVYQSSEEIIYEMKGRKYKPRNLGPAAADHF